MGRGGGHSGGHHSSHHSSSHSHHSSHRSSGGYRSSGRSYHSSGRYGRSHHSSGGSYYDGDGRRREHGLLTDGMLQNYMDRFVISLSRGIAEKGISTKFLEWKTRPHLTLACFSDVDEKALNEVENIIRVRVIGEKDL